MPQLIDAILNLIFPVACIVCNAPVLERKWGAACPACWARTEPIMPPFCPQCGMPETAPAGAAGPCGDCRSGRHVFDFGRSALLFDDTLREIVHHLKYFERVSLARPLGRLLRECFEREPFQAKIALPVPLHRSRRRRRGFNQAELLAGALGIAVERRLLMRRRNTPSQTGLTRAQRISNLAGSFEVRGKVPECALVVDDVYTTGATLDEIARTLKRAGARRVEILTAARVLPWE